MSTSILGKPLTSKVNASEVFRSLEEDARRKMKRQKLSYNENENAQLKVIVYKCRNCKLAIKYGDEKTKKNAVRNLSRLQSEAITIISKDGDVSYQQMTALGLTEEKIQFEMAYRDELADWVEMESDESLQVRKYLEELASHGAMIDYKPLKFFEYQMGILCKEEADTRALSGSILKTKQAQDKMSILQAKIDEEKRRTSALKSKPENLCYHIFCRRSSSDYMYGISERIRRQSRYYLRIMVRIIIHFYNDLYTQEIEAGNKQKEAMRKGKSYHAKKTISAKDKRELIQIGKTEGMKQEEVARELHCSLPTVKRYWNDMQ